MFAGYGFSEFEFLDRNYSLGYARNELKQEKKATQIIQGTYYLLRNGKVTDSLKTPDDLYYNSNYNNYYFSAKNDTVSLGSWTYDDHYTVNTTRYFQPLLVRSKGEWKFKVEEKIYRRPVPAMGQTADTVREFVNFRLINGRKMIFRNGAGSLELKQEIKDEVSGDGCYILEQGGRIYLISPGVYGSVYISFDAGTNWYLYPRPLQPGRSLLLQTEGPNGLSYFSTESTGGTSVMRKIFYDFLPR
ncbi:hypothetical protein FUA25_03580 [Chryseobacterium sp.]|nr:hypothetical protein FUA25_03580 [Chryseobacterium sp.]